MTPGKLLRLGVSRTGRPTNVAGVIVSVAVVLSLGVALGAWATTDTESAAPARPNSVDVGFARDMQVHHAQAVEMSRLVRDSTDDPEVRTLALDIMLTQQQQIGQMYGWLAIWGVSQTTQQAPMSWMRRSGAGGHDMSAMGDSTPQSMPGMASPEDLSALSMARGTTAERIYLQLMIPHHKGALGMARDAANRATQPQVRRLARGILVAQAAEIRLLKRMLQDRGGPVDLGG